MNKLFENRVEISGPINIVRVEGKVGNIEKVMYLFMDVHLEVNDQTKCSNYYSQDVDKFLAKFFHEYKGTKTFDFFTEITVSDFYENSVDKENIDLNQEVKYIDAVNNFFSIIFRYDSANKKVRKSDLLKKLRVHYIDIRDRIDYNFFENAESIFDQVVENSVYSITPRYLSYLIDDLNRLLQNIKNTLIAAQNFKKEKGNPFSTYGKFDEKSVKSLIYKIRMKYKHTNIKSIINSKLDQYLKKYDDVLEKIKNLIKYLKGAINSLHKNKYHRNEYGVYTYGNNIAVLSKIKHDVVVEMSAVYEIIIETSAMVMDLYTIRRFLDKDYITNVICYTGAYHSLNCIHLLVNNFNFKVTHVANLNNMSISTLNTQIKSNDIEFLKEHLLSGIQCSDITKFPKNFA